MATITLKNVIKRFNEIETIHGVNLELEDGEFVVFVGPSGCGKSTLLRLIAGLEDITAGELLIDDARMNDVAPAERGVAMVFQSYALYPHMTVAENMTFGLRMTGAEPKLIEERLAMAADILQLQPLLQRKPRQLSGGQRQRVAIGRAIVREPKVFLFDEPLSNLDAELRVDMRVQIAKLHQQIGATMIYVTHDQVEAMTLADKIVVLRAGDIEQVGSPLELYHNPANEFVAGFIGSPRMNFIPAQVTDLQAGRVSLQVLGQSLQLDAISEHLQPGEMLKLGLRPEHLREYSSECDFNFNFAVDVAEHLGGTTYLYGRSQEHCLTLQVSGQNLSRVGDQLQIGAHYRDCYLFNQAGKAVRARPVPSR